jgi:uncharacterized membrane protein YfcA
VILTVLLGVVLIVLGVVFFRNERRAAARGSRRTRRPYLGACVLMMVLGVLSILLSLPTLIAGNAIS